MFRATFSNKTTRVFQASSTAQAWAMARAWRDWQAFDAWVVDVVPAYP